MQPDTSNSKDELFTIERAANYLGVTRGKIYRLIGEKALEFEVNPLDKRQKLIKRDQLEKLKTFQRRIVDPQAV